MRKGFLIIGLLALVSVGTLHANVTESEVVMFKAHVDYSDKPSLQRGAKLYTNYCAGCHTLKYMRYKQMGQEIGVTDEDGVLLKDLLKDNLIFTGANIGDSIENAMDKNLAREWFGRAPPDLSLATRVFSPDWVYTYLMSFYEDPKRPWGTNNWLFPDVAMPNVLQHLQGRQSAVLRDKLMHIGKESKTIQVIDHLQLLENGTMDEQEFSAAANDIVNFLSFVAQPVKTKRQFLGIWVLLFLSVLLVFVYFMKREYWRDVH